MAANRTNTDSQLLPRLRDLGGVGYACATEAVEYIESLQAEVERLRGEANEKYHEGFAAGYKEAANAH